MKIYYKFHDVHSLNIMYTTPINIVEVYNAKKEAISAIYEQEKVRYYYGDIPRTCYKVDEILVRIEDVQ